MTLVGTIYAISLSYAYADKGSAYDQVWAPYSPVASEMSKESDGLNGFTTKETSDWERTGRMKDIPETHLIR